MKLLVNTLRTRASMNSAIFNDLFFILKTNTLRTKASMISDIFNDLFFILKTNAFFLGQGSCPSHFYKLLFQSLVWRGFPKFQAFYSKFQWDVSNMDLYDLQIC